MVLHHSQPSDKKVLREYCSTCEPYTQVTWLKNLAFPLFWKGEIFVRIGYRTGLDLNQVLLGLLALCSRLTQNVRAGKVQDNIAHLGTSTDPTFLASHGLLLTWPIYFQVRYGQQPGFALLMWLPSQVFVFQLACPCPIYYPSHSFSFASSIQIPSGSIFPFGLCLCSDLSNGSKPKLHPTLLPIRILISLRTHLAASIQHLWWRKEGILDGNNTEKARQPRPRLDYFILISRFVYWKK